MILATRSGDREIREWGTHNTLTAPSHGGFAVAASGEIVDDASATGLPAVGRAIRLVAGLIGTISICVYEGRKGDKRERDDSPQAVLLRAPVLGASDYDWRYDVASSLEITENAFLLKLKDNAGRVAELHHIPSDCVDGRIDGRTGQKMFDIVVANGRRMTLTTDDVLHIRGQTLGGGPFGVSRIRQHRDPLGSMLAAQRFEGSYFRNSARPDVLFVFPEKITAAQAKEYGEDVVNKFGGARNAGKPFPIGGGMTVETIPINLQDAQFIEARSLGVEDVGRIMDVEGVLLGATGQEQQDTDAFDRFLALQMPPRFARIVRALKADPDVFPTGPLYPEFDVDALMFASPTTKSAVQHQQIQAGTLLPDEARADNGRPPLPDGLGQIPLITPVGAAPNPDPMPPEMEPPDTGDNAAAREFHVPAIEMRVEQDMEPVARVLAEAFTQMTAAIDTLAARQAVQQDATEQRQLTAARLQAETLRRALSDLGITVNIEPTPVTVENIVNVDPIPVNVTLELPPEREKTITISRGNNGFIQSATVTEE